MANNIDDRRPLGKHSLTTIYQYNMEVDYAEVVAALLRETETNYLTIDTCLYDLLTENPSLLRDVIEKELSPAVVFNTINTPFGRGLLLGMVMQAIVDANVKNAEENETENETESY